MNERTNLQYAPAPVERFKECLNSHEIKARLKNSLKNKNLCNTWPMPVRYI